MINITIYNGGYSVIGHAEFAEHGQDIVCAAISAIAQTALLGLNKYCKVVSQVEGGDMTVLFVPNDESITIIDTMLMGLKEVEREYPNHVKIQEEINEQTTWF